MTLVHVLILPRMTRTAFSPESIQSLCPLWHISQTAIKKLLIPTDVQIGLLTGSGWSNELNGCAHAHNGAVM